jgi:hypothetical protein
MTLAAILVIFFLTLGAPGYAAQDQAAPAPQTQAPPAQNTKPSATSPAQQQKSTQPAPPHHAHQKKVKTPDCSASSSTAKARGTQTSTNGGRPCPTPKVVVKDGGSDEPTVQLKDDTTATQASNELLNTEQLRLATEENLKKIAGRQLSANQQEMVSQIKQFMDQSKTAVADGDLERGHNLAMKARLLSDELVNP